MASNGHEPLEEKVRKLGADLRRAEEDFRCARVSWESQTDPIAKENAAALLNALSRDLEDLRVAYRRAFRELQGVAHHHANPRFP